MANFTVVVPAFNSERFLEECLNSCLGQTWPDWQCIVVNDGSTDRTAEIVEGYCARDPRFQLLTQENRGLGEARNSGIRAARTPWVALLDSDDYYFPEALAGFEEALKFAQALPSVGVLAANYCHHPKDRIWTHELKVVDAFDSMFGLTFGPPICCSSAALSVGCFADAGGFRSVRCEDRDFWFRAFARYTVCSISDTLAFYRRDQAGTMNDALRAQGQIALAQKEVLERNRVHPLVKERTARDPAKYERMYDVAWNLLSAAYLLPNSQFADSARHFLESWHRALPQEREFLIRYLLDLLPYPQNDKAQSSQRYGELVFGLARALPKGESSARNRLATSGCEAFFRAAREQQAVGSTRLAVQTAFRALVQFPSWRTFRAWLRLTFELILGSKFFA